MSDAYLLKRIEELSQKLAELDHLRNIECVLPLERNIVDGAGVTFSFSQDEYLFPAKITAIGLRSGIWVYDWQEVEPTPNDSVGAYRVKSNGKSGTITNGPYLQEINGNYVELDQYVWVRFRCRVANTLLYEFENCCDASPRPRGHTTDTILQEWPFKARHTTDSLLKKAPVLAPHTTDTYLVVQTALEHTTDTILAKLRRHTTDSLLKKIAGTRTHTTDAYLARLRQHTTDALLKKLGVMGSHSTDAILSSTASCCGCIAVPNQYTMTVAGVVDDACTNCTNYNGDFTLTLTVESLECIWKSEEGDFCPTGTGVIWQLSCDEEYMYLTMGGALSTQPGETARYKKLLSEWGCMTANTLTKDFTVVADCIGWPATLTVTPV